MGFFWHPVQIICKRTVQVRFSIFSQKLYPEMTQSVTLTIKGDDMLSNASSILFAVWLVTPLLPAASFTRKKMNK